jgi:hypothetical protein
MHMFASLVPMSVHFDPFFRMNFLPEDQRI